MSALPMSDAVIVESVLYGADELVANRVKEHIPAARDNGFGACVALGVIRRGALVGGVVFHSYRGHDIEMSAAFETPRWCLPQTLRRLFSYPFVQLGCARMTTITSRINKPARRMDEGLGFRLEGVARKGWDGKIDAMIYGMLREECRWIK